MRVGGDEPRDDPLVDATLPPRLRLQRRLAHQVVPGPENRIVREGAAGDQFAPALGDLRAELVGDQRQEEDGGLGHVRFGRRDLHEVIGGPVARDLLDFNVMRLLLVVDLLQLRGELIFEGLAGGRHFADSRPVIGLDRAGEHAVQRVVIGGRDGVELVVVATGAGDGQAEEAAADDIDLVVDHVMAVAVEHPAQGQ